MANGERRILELFSGIGGMHSALTLSNIVGHVVAAIDINTVANTVYAHNHPNINLLNRNIQSVTPKFIEKLNVNTILMSPPCQPFTRVGNQKDVADSRTDALVHLCEIIEQLPSIDAILMENVKGFETSKARDMYTAALQSAGYHYQEFMLSPSQLGIPNTRYRYYCLARKFQPFPFKSERILAEFPKTSDEAVASFGSTVADYIDSESSPSALLPDKLLEKRVLLLDIASPESTNTICFTKAYTHYTEGTGSVFCSKRKDEVEAVFDRVKILDQANEGISLIKTMQMRYFTPDEVAKLMCFPEETFSFPKVTTTKQRYRLLGNSINVHVVSELIKILFDDDGSRICE